MGRLLALFLTVLLALASAGGYVFLDQKIADAEGRIAAGQGLLAKGRKDLAAGKARLEAGKKDVARSKRLFGLADEESDLRRAGDLIGTRGDRQVAEGEKQVAAGEGRLRAGEWSIRRGSQQLEYAKLGRLACAVGAGLFGSLALVVGFPRRRSPDQAALLIDPQLAVGQQQQVGMAARILGWILVLVLPWLILSSYLFISRTIRHFSEPSDTAALAISVALGLLGVLILARSWGTRILGIVVYIVLVGGGMYLAMAGVLCGVFHDCSPYNQVAEWARVAWRGLVQGWAAVARAF